MLRKFKVAVVVRTLVRIGCERTEVRATFKFETADYTDKKSTNRQKLFKF